MLTIFPLHLFVTLSHSRNLPTSDCCSHLTQNEKLTLTDAVTDAVTEFFLLLLVVSFHTVTSEEDGKNKTILITVLCLI